MKTAENITDADIERLFRAALIIKHQYVLENCEVARGNVHLSPMPKNEVVKIARARLARTLNDLEALEAEL